MIPTALPMPLFDALNPVITIRVQEFQYAQDASQLVLQPNRKYHFRFDHMKNEEVNEYFDVLLKTNNITENRLDVDTISFITPYCQETREFLDMAKVVKRFKVSKLNILFPPYTSKSQDPSCFLENELGVSELSLTGDRKPFDFDTETAKRFMKVFRENIHLKSLRIKVNYVVESFWKPFSFSLLTLNEENSIKEFNCPSFIWDKFVPHFIFSLSFSFVYRLTQLKLKFTKLKTSDFLPLFLSLENAVNLEVLLLANNEICSTGVLLLLRSLSKSGKSKIKKVDLIDNKILFSELFHVGEYLYRLGNIENVKFDVKKQNADNRVAKRFQNYSKLNFGVILYL